MKIVVEYVLIENLLINLITLKTTALLTKEKGRLFFLSAFLGGCLTVALPFFRLNVWGYLLSELGLVVILVCLSFKFKSFKKFLRLYLSFFIVTFLYGGACFFFENLFGIRSLLVVLAVVTAVFFLTCYLARKVERKKNIENFCFDVELEVGGLKSQWRAFLDSGNLLFDPLTQKPVTLINFKVFSTLFSDIQFEDLLKKGDKLKKLKFAHYINFNTLGADNKLLVFQVDKISVGEIAYENATLGLSLKNFNEAFGTDIILHNNFATNGI